MRTGGAGLTVAGKGALVVLHDAALVDQPLQLGRDAGLLGNFELEREHRRLGVHLVRNFFVFFIS